MQRQVNDFSKIHRKGKQCFGNADSRPLCKQGRIANEIFITTEVRKQGLSDAWANKRGFGISQVNKVRF